MTITQQKIDADRINAVRVGVEAFIKAAGCNDAVADVITNHVEALVKQADVIDDVGSWLRRNPEITGGALGGLGGAGVGSLFGGDPLEGALKGGAVGMGLGGVARGINSLSDSVNGRDNNDILERVYRSNPGAYGAIIGGVGGAGVGSLFDGATPTLLGALGGMGAGAFSGKVGGLSADILQEAQRTGILSEPDPVKRSQRLEELTNSMLRARGFKRD